MPGLVRPAIADAVGQEELPGGNVIYVAPGGSDANPGTLGSPKATLQGAHDALPGSPAGWTIVLRGGDYAIASPVAITKAGSSGNPVRVQAYPEETVRLHRGGPFWHLRTPGAHWEQWDAGKNIWRTKTNGEFANGQRIQGYVRIGGHPFALSMMAPGDFGTRFQSNGSDAWLPAAMTGGDGRLYLRLQVRPEHVGTGWPSFVPGCEAGDSFAGVAGDPNDYEVCVRAFSNQAILQIAGGANHWAFFDINLYSTNQVAHITGVVTGLHLTRCRGANMMTLLRIDTNVGPLSDLVIDGHACEGLGDSAPISWSAIKGLQGNLWNGVWDAQGFIQPAWNRNSGGTNWSVTNSLIAFHFDFYNPGSRHPDGVTFEHNWFWRVRDDGRQGNLASKNVKVRFNVFEDSPWGLGDFSNTSDGNYEVAHNVFLMRSPWHWGINDPPIGPSPHNVYPTHWASGTKQSPEQHHNNTYVLAAQVIHAWSGVFVGHVAAEQQNNQATPHEHYNNIYCVFEEREYKGQSTGGESNARNDCCIEKLLTIGNETHNHCHFARASTRSTPRTGLIRAQNQTGAGNGVQTFATLAAFQSAGINSRGDHAQSSQDADRYGLADAAAVNDALPFVDAFGLDFRLKSGHAARSGARGGTTGWRGAVDPDTGLCPDGEFPGPIGAQDGEPDPPPDPEPTPGRQRYLAEALGSQTHSSFAHQVANQLTWTPDPDAAYLVLGSIHVGPIPSGLSGTLTQLQRGDTARSADTRGVHPAVSDDDHTWPILLLDVEAPSPSPASVTWRQVWRGSSDTDTYRVNNARLLALRLEEGDAWARSDTQVDLSDGTATTLATATAPAAGDYLVLASIGYRGNLSPGGADFWVEVDGALLTASRQTAQPSQGTTGDPGSLGSTYTIARVATLAEGDPVALRGQRTVASGTLNTRYARVVLLALDGFFGHTVVEGLSEVTESAGTAATVVDGARNSPAGADHLVLASVLVETQSGRDDSAPTEDAEVALLRNASPLIPTRIGRARTGGTDTPTTWLGMTVSQALGDDAFALTLRSTTSGRTVAARGGSLAILQLDPLGGVTAALAADEAALAAEVTSIEAVAAALAAEEAALDAEATLGLPPETTEAEVVATSTWNTGGSSVASLSWTHDNPATVNLLLVAVRADLPSGSTTTYTVTYGGETMTRLDGWNTTVPGAGGGAQIDVFHLWDPPSGENTVSITPAASRVMHGWAIGVRNADAIEGSEVDRWDNTDDSYEIAVASEEGQLILAAYGWRNSGEEVESPQPAGFLLDTDQGVNGQDSRSALVYGTRVPGRHVVELDGVDGHVRAASRSLTACTIHAEVTLLEVPPSWSVVFHVGGQGIAVGHADDGRLYAFFHDSGWVSRGVQTPDPVPIDEPIEITVSWDGTHLRLYLDRVEVDAESYAASPPGDWFATYMVMGGSDFGTPGEFTQMRWRGFRVLTSALSAGQIESIEEQTASLVRHYRLDEESGETALDSGSDGVDAELAGGAARVLEGQPAGASVAVSVDVVDPPADEAQRAVAVILAISGTAASHDVDAALAAGEATLLAEVEAELTSALDAALEAGEAALAAGVGLHDRAVSARIEAGEAVLAAAAQLGAAPVATPHPIDWVEAGLDRCRLSYGMEPCRALLAGAHAVQHTEDFASQDLGSPPAGWTARWGLDPEVVGVAADGDATGGRLLRAMPLADNRRLLSIDALDGHAQVDQTWRLRSSSTAGAQLRVVARASGSSAETHRAYAATLLNGSNVQVHRIIDGAFTLLGNITHSWAPDAWQRLRLQVAGDHVRCRVWQDGAPEPTSWQVDAVDPTPILDGGWSGLSWFAADGVKEVDLVAAEVGLARHKCFNSWPTCHDPDAFDPEPWWLRVSEATTELPRLAVFAERGLPWWLPLLLEVRHSPVRVDPGRSAGINAEIRITLQDAPYHDRALDKYVLDRGLDPAEHGTLWLKLLRRFRHLSGRVLRWHRGFIGDPESSRTRHYVIEKVDGPDQDGRVTITAKDPLRLTAADRAQAPRPSRGRLLTDLPEAADPASIDVETPDPTEYPATGGIVFLGSEGIQYASASEVGPTTVRLEGITRGLPDGYETLRRSHEAGAAVQLALYYRDERVPDIIADLLVNYVPRFDPAWIPKEDWDREYGTFFAGLRLRRLIAKPEGVRDLLNELVEQTLTWSIWWDEAAQRVRIAVVRPPDIDEPLPRLLDGSHLLSGTVERQGEPDRLVNEVEILYGQRDPTGRLETRENYARARLRRDLDSQSAFDLGQVRLRRVFARWHPSGNTAFVDQWLRRTLTTGLVQTFRLEFDLPRRDGEGLAIGDFVQVETIWIIDDRGLPEPGRMQLLKVEPGRNAVRCTARSDIFLGIRPFARLAPGELAGLRHAEASDAQRLRYLFLAQGDGKMSDGSQGYRLL